MIDFNQFKPIIKVLIKYYYDDLQNTSGGYCHIVLDEGNLSDNSLWHCQELCEKNNDQIGYLIVTTLRHFTEDEREEMYNKDWWGMNEKSRS